MAAKGFFRTEVVLRGFHWFFQQLNSFARAIKEHHHWVPSPRARALEEWTGRVSAALHYTAYVLFMWLAYRLWVSVPKAVAKTTAVGLFAARDSLDFRSSLFFLFAGAFLVPAGLFVIWFLVKWTYKLIEAVAYRRLPRFTRLPFYPAVLCGVAMAGLGYQQPVANLLARAYVEANVVVVAARRSGAGPFEQPQTGALQPGEDGIAVTEKLIEDLRKRNQEHSDQPPPEPLELELDAARGKGSKTEQLTEKVRKHHEDRGEPQPPEPLELELDAARGKGTKVD